MTISLPALFEAPPRASGWAMAACFGLSLLFLVGFVAPSPHADDWGSLATISSTMGIHEGRLCLGESSRGDLGCPTYAPYVSRTIGWVGMGTTSPSSTLHVIGEGRFSGGLRVGSPEQPVTNGRLVSGNDTNNYIQLHDGTGDIFIGTSNLRRFSIDKQGGVMVGDSDTPSTSLQIRGSLRLAVETSPTLQTCDANRRGAIKYENNDFHLCRNGTTWESLTSVAGNTTPDRLISGTTQAIAYQNTSLSLVTAGTERMVIGANGNIGIGTITPTTKLEVAGTVSATTLQLADNPSNPCNAANKGMAKVIDGRIYVCRYP